MYPEDSSVADGVLSVGGCDARELAREFGTPAYVVAEAEDELRRVAGSQLDGRLVWLFVTQVLRGTVVDHDGRIADLEAELQIQRRMRGVLDQPLVLGPPTT